MNDADRREIHFKYSGMTFVIIEVVEGFCVFKEFAEQKEIEYDGRFFIDDQDPYYILEFLDTQAIYDFIDDMSNS